VSTDRALKEKLAVELETPLFEQELPEKRCIDLEYLLLTLPSSLWVITVADANTSLGEDLGADIAESLKIGGGKTRVGTFTGRRRL
jgi:hypothetical protein